MSLTLNLVVFFNVQKNILLYSSIKNVISHVIVLEKNMLRNTKFIWLSPKQAR